MHLIFYTSSLFCLAFVCSLHLNFLLLACTTEMLKGQVIFSFSRFIHDHWPYKLQLVGSDYMLAKIYFFFSFIDFSMSIKISIHLKLSFKALEVEGKIFHWTDWQNAQFTLTFETRMNLLGHNYKF